MGFSKFSTLLALRLFLIMSLLILLSYLINRPGYHASSLLLFFSILALTIETYKFVVKVNNEVSRFLDAARYADFNQRFNLSPLGAGFEKLGQTFDDILLRFQEARTNQEEDLHHLKAIIEHVPMPLMSILHDGSIVLWNNSARRLFGILKIVNLQDLEQFGQEFAKEVANIKAGGRKLVIYEHDGIEQQIVIAATEVIISNNREKLISLQNIQSELDAAQLQAWQDLVRVLTHEIMNSITPVASLSKTAVDLVEDITKKLENNPELLEELSDVKDAVSTVARRSDSLMQFVSSYRSLTRLPQPVKAKVKIEKIFSQITPIATINWQRKGIDLQIQITPIELEIMVDYDMVEQILINLLKNAEQELSHTKGATVKLGARINQSGRAIIEVEDNGKGVAADIAKNIFVPFFTTKRDGSGVGLALTRQVMIAHGGSVTLSNSKNGGAKFTLTF
jgi:nitrogen fixation/metabolism regulation signal transduction histidine kinase